MKTIKNIFNLKSLFLSALLVLGILSLTPAAKTYAQDPCAGAENPSKCQSCQAVEYAGGSDCDESTVKEKVDNTFTTIINAAAIIAGTICVLLILIGGFRYVVSGGESGGVQGAKNTILYALIGLVVVVVARTLVVVVLGFINKN